MRLVKIKISYIYIILFTVAFISEPTFLGFHINYWLKYIIGAIWCSFVYWRLTNSGRGDINRSRRILLLLFFPYIVFLVHLPFALLISEHMISVKVISRVISYFLQRVIIILVPLLTALYFKENAIKYTFFALVMNYSIKIVDSILKFGFSEFVHFMCTAWKDEWGEFSNKLTISHYLEVHDLTFALGFFLIYFLLMYKNDKRISVFYIVLSALLIYLGWKRIEIAGIFIVLLIYKILLRNNRELKSKQIFGVTLFVLFFMVGFIFVIKGSSFIDTIEETYNINLNGRGKLYNVFSEYFDFSVLYFGRGFATTTLLVDQLKMSGVINVDVHSDILKAYIDFGFWGFIFWISYFLYFFPKKISEEKSFKNCNCVAVLFFVCFLYSFIVYLTDNTYWYFDFQVCLFLIPFSLLFSEKEFTVITRKRRINIKQ